MTSVARTDWALKFINQSVYRVLFIGLGLSSYENWTKIFKKGSVFNRARLAGKNLDLSQS